MWFAWYISYFSCCCNRSPYKSNLRKKGYVLTLEGVQIVIMVGKTWCRSLRVLPAWHLQSGDDTDECQCLASSPLLVQPRTSAHDMVPLTIKVGFPTSVNHVYILVHKYALEANVI